MHPSAQRLRTVMVVVLVVLVLHSMKSSSSLLVWTSVMVFFIVGHRHCAGSKVACKHPQHLF